LFLGEFSQRGGFLGGFFSNGNLGDSGGIFFQGRVDFSGEIFSWGDFSQGRFFGGRGDFYPVSSGAFNLQNHLILSNAPQYHHLKEARFFINLP
jgi:hypothetical protein